MRQLANLQPRVTIRNETPPTIKGGGNVPTCTVHTMTKQTSALHSYLNHRSPAQSHGDNSFRYSRLAGHFTKDPPPPPLPPACLTNTARQEASQSCKQEETQPLKWKAASAERHVPQGRFTLAVAEMNGRKKRARDGSRWIFLHRSNVTARTNWMICPFIFVVVMATFIL